MRREAQLAARALLVLLLACAASAQPRGSTIVGAPGVRAAGTGGRPCARARRRRPPSTALLLAAYAHSQRLTRHPFRPASVRLASRPAAAPVLSSLSPSTGVREGGVAVTLVGAGFQRTRGLSVRFSTARGSVVVPATFVDASTIGARSSHATCACFFVCRAPAAARPAPAPPAVTRCGRQFRVALLHWVADAGARAGPRRARKRTRGSADSPAPAAFSRMRAHARGARTRATPRRR
jgi:hypothetical protein